MSDGLWNVDKLIVALQAIQKIGAGQANILIQTGRAWPKGNGIKYEIIGHVCEPVIMDPNSVEMRLVKELTDETEYVLLLPYEEVSDEVL